MILFTTLSFMFVATFIGTLLIIKYAESKKIIDIPNNRSSHTVPTPRGGGLSFVISFLFLAALIKYLRILPISINFYGFLSLSIIASLGFYDDKKALSPLLRCLVQVVSASVLFASFLPIPALYTKFIVINPSILLNVLIVLYLVWLLNLYNFMDGINGIASLEAISVNLGMCVIYWLTGNTELIPSLLLLVMGVIGFLPWNFPKAKIFMGDAGSSFLGFIIGIFSLQAFVIDSQLFWSWLVLLGVFIVDSSLTLMRRFLNGEKVYLAHCSHAYQQAARRVGDHIPITFYTILINMIWLFPISMLIGMHYLDGFWGLIISYLPLVFLCVWLDAGKSC